MSAAITVRCPSCTGARTIVFDHIGGRVEGYCPRCQPDPMTSHLTPDVQALTAEVERLRARIERAHGALSKDGASNYERVQAAGLILAFGTDA